jgi:ABC-2 type transport system ATP-binding protein
MITIESLCKTYRGGVHALQNVSLTIGTGMFGLLGPNGAGKTTLMRILATLQPPTSGTVRAFDHDLSQRQGRQAIKQLLGYLPQETGHYPHLTAAEFLDYIAILKGIHSPTERRQQVQERLEQVRLSDVANRPISTYSGGMKQRVGMPKHY